MRICLVTSYDLVRDGGVNRHVCGLAAALRRLGDQVAVLGPASGPIPSDCDGLSGVVAVPANGSTAHIGLFVRAAATRAYLRRGAFDVVHVHEPIVPGPARQATSANIAPVVATFHSYAENEFWLMRRARQTVCWPLRKLRQGIAVSEAAASFARPIYAGPLHIIANGTTTAEFRPVMTLKKPARRGLRVLFAGRFGEPRKGLRYLLEAASLLAGTGHLERLIVVGDGPAERFRHYAGAAPVEFCGRVDDATLAWHYQNADVFCAPSAFGESFGLVLIEAMAAACVVLASDIPGYAEAAGGAAYLVPPADAQALAQALKRLAGDESLRSYLRERGSVRANELDWEHLAPQIRAVYMQAAGIRDAQSLDKVGT